MLRILLATLLTLLSFSYSFADNHPAEKNSEDFARYNANLAASLFGPSANFGYNTSKKTMFVFALGMFSGNAPFDPEIDGTSYKMSGSASWMGFFLNHRPIETAPWFRLVAGFGIGNIENDLEDDAGNTYAVKYQENPVGYMGLGFGTEAKKGFLWGVDFGILQTNGSVVRKTGGMSADDKSEQIGDNVLFGSVLPNFQFSLGWGF